MPKQAKSSTAKVRHICHEYPDEFSATPARDLPCNLCDELVKCDKKFLVESHRKSKQHQRKLEAKSKSQSKQIFLQLDQVNFKEQVVSSFLAADIPLHKLNYPSLKSLFATMGKVLPSETAARACVAKLASQKKQIQELLRGKKFFLIVDEAEIAKQNYISVLVGSLDATNQTFLVDCHPLDSGSNVNSSIILHTVDDILRQLEIKRENFSLLLTDATRNMSLTGKTLKELYPSLMHVTCVAHLLHNCAMRVRAHFKNIDEIIATIKAAELGTANLNSIPQPQNCKRCSATANPQVCNRFAVTFRTSATANAHSTSANLDRNMYCYFVFVMTFFIFEGQILLSTRR